MTPSTNDTKENWLNNKTARSTIRQHKFTGSWIVLPYHFCWLPLLKVVAKFRRLWNTESMLAEELNYLRFLAPRISWSRGGSTLLSRLGRRVEDLVIVQN